MSDSVEELDEDAIRTIVTRLARPRSTGDVAIERAAILAEGAGSAAILRWMTAHGWEPEAPAVPTSARAGLGVHGGRRDAGRPATGTPLRYVRRAG